MVARVLRTGGAGTCTSTRAHLQTYLIYGERTTDCQLHDSMLNIKNKYRNNGLNANIIRTEKSEFCSKDKQAECNQFSFTKEQASDCSHLRSLAPPPPPCGGHRPAGQGASRSGPRTPGSPCSLRVRRSAWAGCCTCSSQRHRCTAHLHEKNRLLAGNLSVRHRLTKDAHQPQVRVCVCMCVCKT